MSQGRALIVLTTLAVLGIGLVAAATLRLRVGEPAPTPPATPDPTPIEPTPIAPTPIAPTPIKPTPIKPTPIKPTPIAANTRPQARADPGFNGGTIFAQVELSRESARLLHLRIKSGLAYRLRPLSGTHWAHLKDAGGRTASVPFTPEGLNHRGEPAESLHGDEAFAERVSVLIRLPNAELPATLRIVDPSGAALATLDLE